MKDPRRWLLILGSVVVLVSVLYEMRRPVVKATHGPCLTHENCLTDERCFVIPKGDGFASEGRCSDPCSENLRCAPGFDCRDVAVAEGHMLPTELPSAPNARAKLCLSKDP